MQETYWCQHLLGSFVDKIKIKTNCLQNPIILHCVIEINKLVQASLSCSHSAGCRWASSPSRLTSSTRRTPSARCLPRTCTWPWPPATSLRCPQPSPTRSSTAGSTPTSVRSSYNYYLPSVPPERGSRKALPGRVSRPQPTAVTVSPWTGTGGSPPPCNGTVFVRSLQWTWKDSFYECYL